MTFDYALAEFIDFQDKEACERVRRITRQEITRHPNPDFRIQVIDDVGEFYGAFATDIVRRVKLALDEGMLFVYDKPAFRRFWMKHTTIPLDIIFISDQKK